jgi:endonuclease YncB( thermonuclease family)
MRCSIDALCWALERIGYDQLSRPRVFFLLLFILSSSHAASLTGRMVRVIDGDTIVVLDAEKVQHKIRLQGIDAPESGQAYGTQCVTADAQML